MLFLDGIQVNLACQIDLQFERLFVFQDPLFLAGERLFYYLYQALLAVQNEPVEHEQTLFNTQQIRKKAHYRRAELRFQNDAAEV